MGQNWLDKEYQNVKEQREKFREESGFKDAVKLKKGENKIVVDMNTEPKIISTKYGERYVFTLKEPADKVLMCAVILYGQIIERLATTKKPEVVVLRSGEGADTKLELIKD
jgi:aspartate aminotransferase-like enzyme